MPRMQGYLPDDLYEQVKSRRLPASELLQEAVRAEVRRQDLLAETDAYLAELTAEVGEPSSEERSSAEAIARRLASRRAARASRGAAGPHAGGWFGGGHPPGRAYRPRGSAHRRVAPRGPLAAGGPLGRAGGVPYRAGSPGHRAASLLAHVRYHRDRAGAAGAQGRLAALPGAHRLCG